MRRLYGAVVDSDSIVVILITLVNQVFFFFLEATLSKITLYFLGAISFEFISFQFLQVNKKYENDPKFDRAEVNKLRLVL